MNWQEFKNYLTAKILEKNLTNYSLKKEAQSKYRIKQEKELVSVLTKLIESIDNYNEYEEDDAESEYYGLPALTDLLNAATGTVKTWQDYFPQRENTYFGKKQEMESEISKGVWQHLAQIFRNYALLVTRPQRLEAFVSDEEMMNKILLEGLARLNKETLKKQGYDTQLKNWLVEYEELNEEDQERLAKPKKQVESILNSLQESKTPKETETKDWYHNIPWTEVIWYSCGLLLIILVLGWLNNKRRGS